MNLNDPSIESRTARSLLDSADETLTGSYDTPDYGVLRTMVRKAFGLADDAIQKVDTETLLRRGQQAIDEPDTDPAVLREIGEEIEAPLDTPDPTDAGKSPLQAPDADNIDAQGNVLPADQQQEMVSGKLPEGQELAQDIVEARTQERERRTWERNVNLDYVNSNSDIGAVLDTVAEYLPTAERESLAAVEAGADYAGLKQFLTEQPNANLTSRQLVAGRNMLVTMTEQVDILADKIAAGDNRTENIAQFEKLTQQTYMLQQFMQGKIRESARALNSMRVVARAVNSSKIETIAKTLGEGSAEAVAEKAKYIQEMRAQGLDEAAMIQEMGGFSAARTLSSVINLRTAGLLTGFRTHIVNGVSNAGMGAYNNLLVYPMAAMISPVRKGVERAIGREARQGVSRPELYTRMAVFNRGLRDAVTMATRVFKEGFEAGEYVSTFEGRRKLDEALEDTGLVTDALGLTKASESDNPVVAALAGVTKRPMDVYQRGVEAFSYGGLTASDEFFKAMAYQQGMTGHATRQAMSENLKGRELVDRVNELLTNPTKGMHDAAMLEAERQTFTDTVEGGIIGTLNSLAKKMVSELPLMRIVAPFINTPTSLVNRAYQNSPAALLSKEFRERIAAGGGDADLALAQMAVGSSLMAWVILAHDDGTITGKGPEDRAQMDALRATGWQPRSIRINDKYYSYDRMDPFGLTIGTLADVLDKAAYQDRDATAGELVAAGTLGIAQQTIDSTWMRGMSELMLMATSYKDPGRYAADVTTSFIPSFVTQAGRLTRPAEEGIPAKFYPSDFWAQLDESVQSRLPNNPAPARRYWNGEKIVPFNGEKMWFYYNNVSPIPVSQVRDDHSSVELTENGVNVTAPKPVVSFRGGGKLDLINDLQDGAEIYDKMLEFVGTARKNRVEQVITTDAYIMGEVGPGRDDGRWGILTDAIRKGRSDGMKQFIQWAEEQTFDEEKHGPMVKYLNSLDRSMLAEFAEMDALTDEQLEQAQTMRIPGSANREGLPAPRPQETPLFEN